MSKEKLTCLMVNLFNEKKEKEVKNMMV